MSYEEQIEKIVGDVWTSMLGLEIHKVSDEASQTAPDKGGSAFCGCVHITGGWEGVVALYLSDNLASTCTESMFALDPGTASETELRDAVGELTNMVGGNFKSTLDGACSLSIPSVIEGGGFQLSNPGCSTVSRSVFDCQGKTMSVIVQKKG